MLYQLKLFFNKVICDVTGQNQSHVMSQNVKEKKSAFYLKMSKYVHLLFSLKTNYLCKFLPQKGFLPFSVRFFHVFFAF